MNGSNSSPMSQFAEYEYCMTKIGLSASHTEVPRKPSTKPRPTY